MVAEESVSAIECKRKDISELQDSMKRGVFLRAEDIREEILGNNFPFLVRSIFPLIGRLDFAIQLAEMRYIISKLAAGDRAVHDWAVSSKKSQQGSREVQTVRKVRAPAGSSSSSRRSGALSELCRIDGYISNCSMAHDLRWL
jgi:hypothetical protein